MKNLWKKQKSRTKILSKNLRTKNLHRQKRLKIPFFWKVETNKETQRKICAKCVENPSPNKFWE